MLQILEDVERAGVMSDLEKDMLLADLREAYSEVKFGAVLGENTVSAQPESEVEECDEPEMEVEILFAEEDEAETETNAELEESVVEEPVEESDEDPSVTPVVAPLAAAATVAATTATAAETAAETATEAAANVASSVVEPAVEPAAEPIVESVANDVVAVEPTVEPAVETPVVEQAETPIAEEELSIVNSQLSANKPHRNAILSLYDDAPAVLGEQFSETPSVADMIASTTNNTPAVAPIVSLHDAINVADKFMLVQDLFGGNSDAYESAINALDSLHSFDDSVIFISENYTWSPNSEGAKFMMELLQRKYNA